MLGELLQEASFARFTALLGQAHAAPPGSHDALTACSKAKKLFDKPNSLPHRIFEHQHDYYHGMLLCIEARNTLSLCSTLEEQAEAVERYEKGIALLAKTEFREEWAHAAINLADFCRERALGLYDERVRRARKLYEELMPQMKSARDNHGLWHVANGLLEIYLERAPQADPLAFERGLTLCQELLDLDYVLGNDQRASLILFTLGHNYLSRVLGRQGNNQFLAFKFLGAAMALASPEADLELWAKIRLSLAHCLFTRPDLGEQLSTPLTARALLAETTAALRSSQYNELLDRAELLDAKSRAAGSEADAELSLEKIEKLCGSTDWARFPAFAPEAYFRWGETALSCFERFGHDAYLAQAERAFRQSARLIKAEFEPDQYIRVLAHSATVYVAQGKWSDAHKLFSEVFDFSQADTASAAYHLDTRRIIGPLGHLLSAAPFVAAAVGEVELAISRYELLNARKLKHSLSTTELATGNDSARLTNLNFLGEGAIDFVKGEERRAWLDKLDSLRAKSAVVENNQQHQPGSDATYKRMDAWIVLPLMINDHTRTILIPPNAGLSDAILSPITRGGLRDIVSFVIGSDISSDDTYAWSLHDFAETRDLWSVGVHTEGAVGCINALFGHWVSARLKVSGVKPDDRAVIVCNSIINLLPVTLAGRDEHPGTSLAENTAVSVMPSIAALALLEERAAQVQKKPASQPRMAFVRAAVSDLPTLDFEREIVIDTFGSLAKNISPESKAVLFENLNESSYWHFSTHGAFNTSSPEKSALKLTDGTSLPFYEIAGLKTKHSLRLVVLSSCFAGAVDSVDRFGDFTGLPSAFFQLGAQGILANIWPVSDEASALLMARFYKEHITLNQEPAIALSKAQRWLARVTAAELTKDLENDLVNKRTTEASASSLLGKLKSRSASEQSFAHPFFWGGYVLYGQ
ncbi:MAG: CHAT domain-containing protein [Cohaesibacteraceae bacterium]